MDVLGVKNKLINQPDMIILILENLKCRSIKYNKRKNYISSTRPDADADNTQGQLVYCDNLFVTQTTRSYKGDIFTLIMDTKNISLPESVRLVIKWLNIKIVEEVHVKYPFNGFFKELLKLKRSSTEIIEQKIYSKSDLPSSNNLSLKFINDGVSAQVQEELGIRYDHNNNCIVIPIYDYMGNLVGAKARNNDPNCDPNKRFWAFLEYSKNQNLYGWFQNYKNIITKDKVIIVEAEKSVAIAKSFGCNICLAIGGHTLSEVQAKYIRSLGVKTIIVCFDEGVKEEDIIYNCKKLQVNNQFVHNKVGYIFDADNKYLKSGSKDSPIDLGKELFAQIIKEKTKFIEKGCK